MAAYYFDRNAQTLGFGTFTQTVNNSNQIPGSTNSSGLVIPGVLGSGSTANTYSFGSPATNDNTTPGTFTFQGTGTFTANGIFYQNLTGNQTWTKTTGTGALTLGGTNPFIEVTATGKLIFSVFPLQGTVNWEKRGASTLQLNAANTFSGGMTIAAGTVEIGNASALGTGTVTMTGGKLSSSSGTGYGLANAFSLSGSITVGDSTNNGYLDINGTTTLQGNTTIAMASTGNDFTFRGAINAASAAYTLTASATGNLRFFGPAGNVGGQVTLAGGNIFLADATGTPNQFGSAPLAITGNSVYLQGDQAYTFTQNVSGTGDLYVTNRSTGGLTFNLFSYSGSLRLYAGDTETTTKMTIAQSGALGWASLFFLIGGGKTVDVTQTLSYSGSGTASNANGININTFNVARAITAVIENASSGNATITLSGGVFNDASSALPTQTLRLAATAGAIAYSGNITETNTGTLNFSKTGSNTVTLTGDNTFKGTVSVSAGTLNANSVTALGADTSSGTVTSGATLSLGAAPTYTTRSLAVSGTGVSSTVGALVINNTGTSNTFQSITLGSTTYIRATSSGVINAPFTSNDNSIIFGASAGSDFMPFLSAFNVFSGTGSVTYGGHSLDTGIVQADVRHTYTGNTTLAYGTTSVASSTELPGTGGPLGNKSLTAANTLLMTGGTLSYLGGNVDYSGRFSTAGSQQWKIDAAGQTVTYATALVGASSLSLNDTSTGGSLTLSSSASTFSSGVNLVGGKLNLGAPELKTGLGVPISGPLGLTGAITFTGGTLQYSSVNQNDYSFRFSTNAGQQWKIDTNGQDVTFSSALTSTGGSLVKLALGTLTLAVANAYNSGTTLSVGTLKCGNAASLGTGGLAQTNGTTLHVATADGKMTITGAHTNTGTGSRIIRIGAA